MGDFDQGSIYSQCDGMSLDYLCEVMDKEEAVVHYYDGNKRKYNRNYPIINCRWTNQLHLLVHDMTC